MLSIHKLLILSSFKDKKTAISVMLFYRDYVLFFFVENDLKRKYTEAQNIFSKPLP